MSEAPINVRLKTYWGHVREMEKELGDPEYFFVTSIENPYTGQRGGVICEVNRESAAIFIVKKSHRLSTKAEIAAHKKEAEEISARIKSEDFASRMRDAFDPSRLHQAQQLQQPQQPATEPNKQQ